MTSAASSAGLADWQRRFANSDTALGGVADAMLSSEPRQEELSTAAIALHGHALIVVAVTSSGARPSATWANTDACQAAY